MSSVALLCTVLAAIITSALVLVAVMALLLRFAPGEAPVRAVGGQRLARSRRPNVRP